MMKRFAAISLAWLVVLAGLAQSYSFELDFRSFGHLGSRVAINSATRDFPFPTFPSTILAKFQTTADIQNNFIGTATDVADPDSPYGSTSIQETFNGGTSTLVSKTTVSPVNVTGGMIRWTFKPGTAIKLTSSPFTSFNIRLYSAGTPSSPSANYHQGGSSTFVNTMSTATAGASTGRWQSVSFNVGAFTAVGTGADLTQITFATILARASNGTIAQIGNIEFFANPRSKALMMFRFDDGGDATYTVAYPLLQSYGAPGMLAIGDASHAINGGSHVTTAQVQTMLNAGWQFLSQSLTTEDQTTFDGWTSAQRDAEFQGFRTLGGTFGKRRDTYDMTYFSSVGPPDMIAWPNFKSNGRTVMRFQNWNAGINPPFPFDETFPPGDPDGIISFNLNSESGGANTTSQLQILLDRVRTNKGMIIISCHPNSDLTDANASNRIAALTAALTEAYTTNPTQWDVMTLRQALAPYNGDNLQNFLLKRDLDPASNDNTPMWLEKAA